MKNLSKKQLEIVNKLESGCTISEYRTGNEFGYSSYTRWDDNLEVIPCKTIQALRRKGYEINIKFAEGVIVKYDPKFLPKKIYC